MDRKRENIEKYKLKKKMNDGEYKCKVKIKKQEGEINLVRKVHKKTLREFLGSKWIHLAVPKSK